MRRSTHKALTKFVKILFFGGILLTLTGAVLNWPGRIGLACLFLWVVGELLMFREHPEPANDRPTMIGNRRFMWGREPGLLGDWLSK